MGSARRIRASAHALLAAYSGIAYDLARCFTALLDLICIPRYDAKMPKAGGRWEAIVHF